MDELNTRCRRYEANFISIGDCLSVIEKDSAINDASNEALQKAQECVRDCMNLKTGVYKLWNTGRWLDAFTVRQFFSCVSKLLSAYNNNK